MKDISVFQYILILFMTFIASYGALLLKRASSEVFVIKDLIRNRYFFMGVSFYFLAALSNIYLLKFIPYGILIPIGGLTYVWTSVLSVWILKESMSLSKILGVFFIILGISLVNM